LLNVSDISAYSDVISEPDQRQLVRTMGAVWGEGNVWLPASGHLLTDENKATLCKLIAVPCFVPAAPTVQRGRAG